VKLFPTLNIRQGQVIPTAGGPPSGDVQMGMDPLRMAEHLLDHGAHCLALVDVDAAQGVGHNRELIGRILARCAVKAKRPCVQVAGGIRASDQAQYFLDLGANWLVVGTILHKSPSVVENLLGRFRAHLTAAIDARGGQVHRSGWVASTGLDALALAERAKAYGFRRLLFVDIPEDEDAAPDFETARHLAQASKLPLLMGGSLTRPEHLRAAAERGDLHGAIVDALLLIEDPALMELIHPASCA